MGKMRSALAIGLAMVILVAVSALLRRAPSGREPDEGRVQERARRAPSLHAGAQDVPWPERGSVPPGGKVADRRLRAESASVVPGEPPSPGEGAHREGRLEQGFWDDLGVLLEAKQDSDLEKHREAVMEDTARYLELDRPDAEAFRAASRQALLEIESAWRVRDEGWLTVSANVGLEAELREEMERLIQERYEMEKRAALGRVEGVLGEGPRRTPFRARLEEWIDAVR